MIKMVFDCIVYVVVFLFAIYVGHLIRKVNSLNTPNTKTEKKNPEKHVSCCCGNCKYFYRKADGGLVTSCCRKGVNDVCPYDICDWYESYI